MDAVVKAEPRRPIARVALRRLGWSITLGLGVLVAVAGLTGSVSVVSVESDSMAPTYCPGARLLVWHVGASDGVDRGEVVTARDPRGGEPLLKRVAAVGGERLEVRDSRLYVDGARVREPYVDRDTVDGTFFGPVTVPADEVFLLGDGREHSVDSRHFGTVPAGDVTGQVLFGVGGRCPPTQ